MLYPYFKDAKIKKGGQQEFEILT